MPTLTAVYVPDLGRVQLTAGDLDTNVVYALQRQTALEPTWVDVRGGQEISSTGTTVVNDYEYTPNMLNTYRLIGPLFYDSFARVFPVPIEEGFETLPLDVTITQGTSPGIRLNLPNTVNTNYVSTPDAAALDVPGDIDVRIDVTSFTSTADVRALMGKWGTAGNRSFLFTYDTGTLELTVSVNGTAMILAQSTADLLSVLTFTRQRIKLRATRASATGTVNFYYSMGDISTGPWTQLGASVAATSGVIFNGPAPLRVGSDQNGVYEPFIGDIHRAQVYSGIAGTLVANPDFTAQPVGTTPFLDSAGRTWSFNGDAAIVNSTWSTVPWARTTAQAHTGSWSLESGAIADAEVSDAVVTVPVDASTVQFWYRVDSEPDFDFLQVFVDSTLILEVDGFVNWTQSAIFDVSSASNVTFRYIKDGSTAAGDDAAWIDDLVFGVAAMSGSSWGVADTGQTWNTNTLAAGANLYVNSGVGVVSDLTPNGTNARITTDPLPAAAVDAEITFSAICPDAIIGQGIEYNVGIRATDQNNYYEAQVIFEDETFSTPHALRIRLSKRVAGVFTGLTSPLTIGIWTESVPWNVRFRVVGETMQMRAWEDGADEPTSWQLAASDASLTTGTAVHVRAVKTSGGGDLPVTQWFGPMSLHSVPETALALASVSPDQEDTFLKSVQFPSLNKVLDCVDWDALTRDSRAGLFDIKGRHEILAVTDVGSSASFNLTFVTHSKAENRAVVALLTYGGVLLLQPPGDTEEDCQFGTFSGIPAGYVVPGNSVQAHSVHGQPIWKWTVAFTKVAAPSGDIVGTTITWQQLWDIIGPEGTWEDVWATWPTWQEIWATNGSAESFFQN